jgi:pimeloyl-ACP methyl ester carboxylesterase
MFLFLHDLASTNSSWLPVIRSTLSLGADYSDRFLLETFTISLPGHPQNDAVLNESNIEKSIQKFIKQKYTAQLEIGKDMIFFEEQKIVKSLKSQKIILIGSGLGSVLALKFAVRNPDLLERLVLINCGQKFHKVGLFFLKLKITRLKTKKSPELHKLLHKQTDLNQKLLLSNLIENSDSKALKSGLKILRKFNFEKIYKTHLLETQRKLNQIPILAISGKQNPLVKPNSVKNLQKVFSGQKLGLFKNIFNFSNKSSKYINPNFALNIYPKSSTSLLQSNLPQLVIDIKDFLNYF